MPAKRTGDTPERSLQLPYAHHPIRSEETEVVGLVELGPFLANAPWVAAIVPLLIALVAALVPAVLKVIVVLVTTRDADPETKAEILRAIGDMFRRS